VITIILRSCILSCILIASGSYNYANAQINDYVAKVLPVTGEKVDTQVKEIYVFKEGETAFYEQIDTLKAKRVKLLFSVFDSDTLESNSWEVQVGVETKDRLFNSLWRFSSKEIEENEVWSPELPVENLYVRLRVIEPASNLNIKVNLSEIIRTDFKSIPFSIIGEDNIEPISKAPEYIKNVASSVVMIKFKHKSGIHTQCTGHFIGDNHILTNNHCISTERERRSAWIIYDFDGKLEDTKFEKPDRVLYTDEALDFTILLTNKSGLLSDEKIDRNLELSNSKFLINEKLVVIHHPDLKFKHFSAQECHVTALLVPGVIAEKTDFEHSCDTLPGSSGAPIFLKREVGELKLIGLHHFGFNQDGDRLNRGVYINKIKEVIENKL